MQLVTWPIKKFLNYVSNKVLGDYLETALDFEKVGYRDGALTLNDIALNVSVCFSL